VQPVPELVIQSNRSSDRLAVAVVEPQCRWLARVEFGDVRAEATVYERWSGDALRLDAYFGRLAAQWRGWNGDEEWEGLGLRLAARHDGLGHITIDAVLEQDYAMAERWRLRASIQVDAGTLGDLSRDAASLDAA
jgi:Family of unknown function (DUF6228)